MPELIGAIDRIENLVRRVSSGRDVQGDAHTLADDTRTSSPDAVFQDDLEKHVQLNRERRNQNIF